MIARPNRIRRNQRNYKSKFTHNANRASKGNSIFMQRGGIKL